MDFSGLPDGAPHVLDRKAKWAEEQRRVQGDEVGHGRALRRAPRKLQKVALEAYRALRVRDYGRVDLRLTETGEIYVIEVNANCYLERSSEFAAAAAVAGIDYPTLIERIAQAALERRQGRARETARRAAEGIIKFDQGSASGPDSNRANSDAQ